MADVKWIKIVTDIFDDEKIQLIEGMPEADSIIVIWFKLLCLAGRTNSSGVLMMSNKIPYTEDMLATIFRRKKTTVQLALEVFQQFGMIEIINNVITIPNWGKHQTLDIIEKRREYQREYMAKKREEQKQLTCKPNSRVNSKPNSETNVRPIEGEVEGEVDIEVDNILLSNDNNMSVDTDQKSELHYVDLANILDYWNKKSLLPSITKITDKRKRHLNARFKEHGLQAIYDVIKNCSESPFMRGQNKQNWMASFDWVFGSPNNFIKVLEGNYLDSNNSKFTKEQKIYEQTMRNLEGFK